VPFGHILPRPNVSPCGDLNLVPRVASQGSIQVAPTHRANPALETCQAPAPIIPIIEPPSMHIPPIP
jgi:hypothetical protein